MTCSSTDPHHHSTSASICTSVTYPKFTAASVLRFDHKVNPTSSPPLMFHLQPKRMTGSIFVALHYFPSSSFILGLTCQSSSIIWLSTNPDQNSQRSSIGGGVLDASRGTTSTVPIDNVAFHIGHSTSVDCARLSHANAHVLPWLSFPQS